MSRALRIALMWLVALALPVQGVAAATMMFCAPTHQSSAVHDHASHDHAAHGHHLMSDGAAPAADDGAEFDDGSAAPLDDTVSCSVCASCCTSATLPSPLAVHEQPKGHPVYQAVVASSDASFLTCGLDRPPRPTLA